MKLRRILNAFWTAALCVLTLSCEDKNAGSADDISIFKVEKSLYSVPAEGGSLVIPYTFRGGARGKTATVTTDASWVSIETVNAEQISLEIEANADGTDRSATILLSADGVEGASVHLLQSKVSDSSQAYSNFTVTTSNITSSGVDVEVEPLNPSAYYYTDLFTASQYDAYGEAYIVNSILSYVSSMASYAGVDDPRVLLYQGYYNSATDENVSLDLRDDTDYYVVVVDVDFDEEGNIISSGKGVFHKFHTAKATQVDLDFTFEISGVRVNVTPSADYTYVCGLVSKANWDEYTNKCDAARDYIAIAKQYSMLDSIVLKGKSTVDFTYLLEASGEYVVYAVGYRNTDKDKGISSEISYQVFTYTK
jgi:hypothetical protein